MYAEFEEDRIILKRHCKPSNRENLFQQLCERVATIAKKMVASLVMTEL